MKLPNLNLFGVLLLTMVLFSCKPNDNEEWAKQGGGDSYDGGRSLALDSKGNVYVIGRFQGNAMFDNMAISGKGDDGVFLVKYNNKGDIIWVKECGGKKEDSGYSIDVDVNDNIFITGYFEDDASFENKTLKSNGESDAFIAKYDTTGNILWVKQIGGIQKDVGRGVATDAAGNSIVVGFFSGSINIDTITLKSSSEKEDIFIANYDKNGNVLWAKSIGGNGSDRVSAIAADKLGNFFITGFFEETVGFDSVKLITSGQSDVFTAMFDKNGKTIWANQIGGVRSDEGKGITIDEQSNVYVTGFFRNQIFLNGSNYIELKSKGESDVFVAKYNSTGNLQWAQSAGGEDLDEASSVTASNSNGCIVAGFFGKTSTFGDSTITSIGNSDVFVAQYDTNGKVVNLMKAGSIGIDDARSVKIDLKNNIYLTGNYNGVFSISGMELPQSRGDGDAYTTKFKASLKK